ncbi:amidohydrolase [Rhodococcus aerolatus]
MSTQLLLGGHVQAPGTPDATAMAVTDGTVVWVGQDRPGRALHPDAEVVELDGAWVAPAFVDTHVHATSAGLALLGLDLTAATSTEHCLALVAEHAAAHPEDAVVWGHGWDESRWPGQRPPSRAEVDACAPGRPIYLSRVDVHSALASTALVSAADGAWRDPGWSDDGPLVEQAHHRVRDAANGLLGGGQRSRAQHAFLDHAASLGVVAVHECGGAEIGGLADFQQLLAVGRPDGHGVEVRGYWGEAVRTADEARALLERTGAHALGGDLFVDGSLGSRTAWLREPFCDDPHDGHNTGMGFLDADAVAAHLAACTEVGVQGGFHVIGDAGVAAVVDGLARTVAQLGGPVVASRGHRLEHVEMVDAEQAAALAGWGVLVSVQPAFDALWGGPDGLYVQRLGPDRGTRLNPFATLASAGVGLAIGSDVPVTTMDPWAAVRAAVHHRTPGQGISPRAAFAAATRGAWRAGGVRDGVTGLLTPGAPASYAVWDVDELVVAAPRDAVARWSTDPRAGVAPLPDVAPGARLPRCLRTVHRGRTLYAA